MKSLGYYWGIKIIYPSGIKRIVFDLTSPYLLTLYFVASLLSIRRKKETSNGNVELSRGVFVYVINCVS